MRCKTHKLQSSIRAIAAALDLNIEQMDVRTDFLYGQVQEEIYVEQPPLYNDGTKRVCVYLKRRRMG